jgi:hypothetical protein
VVACEILVFENDLECEILVLGDTSLRERSQVLASSLSPRFLCTARTLSLARHGSLRIAREVRGAEVCLRLRHTREEGAAVERSQPR